MGHDRVLLMHACPHAAPVASLGRGSTADTYGNVEMALSSGGCKDILGKRGSMFTFLVNADEKQIGNFFLSPVRPRSTCVRRGRDYDYRLYDFTQEEPSDNTKGASFVPKEVCSFASVS